MKRQILLISLLLLGLCGALFAVETTEITGEVIKCEETKDPETNTYMLRIQVRLRNQGDEKQIQNQEMVNAHLGPVWMFDTDLNPGDEVVIKGKYKEHNQFMVQEMVRNNVRYRIRNENGEPLWIRERVRLRNHFYNPATEKLLKCKIDELCIEKETNVIVGKAQLENGETVQLRFAPEWYLQNRLRVGDEIELRGSKAYVDGQKMIIVREMRNLRTRNEIQLRNREGFPEWCGKGECEQHRTTKGACCGDDKKEHGRKHR